MSTKLKIIISLLFLVQGAVLYWSYTDKTKAEFERLKPYAAYLENPLAVKSIDLSHQNLTALEIDFSQFQNLESLDLSHNEFERIPKVLYSLPKLTTLNISHNKISYVFRFYKENSKNQPLDLSRNNLENLDLSYNQFRMISSVLFDLPKLKNLNLAHNDFSGIVKLKKKNSTIQRLNLSNNQIIGFNYPKSGLDYLEALKTINLSNNRLESTPDFNKMKLDTILMRNNQLDNIGKIEANLPDAKFNILRHLDISNNEFKKKSEYNSDIHYEEMTDLAKKCISLNISGNFFNRFPYEVFGDYELKHLNISNIIIESHGIIINNNSLETLDLSKSLVIALQTTFETSRNLRKLNLKGISVISLKLSNKTLEELYIENIDSVNELSFPNLKIINVNVYNGGTEQLIKSKSTLPKLEKIILENYQEDNFLARNKLAKAFPNAEIIIESFAKKKRTN